MRTLLRAVPVPLILILLVIIAPPAIIATLAIWSEAGDVPYVDVDFFPDHNPPLSALPRGGQVVEPNNGQLTPAPSDGTPPPASPQVSSEVVVADANFPVSLAFAPDGRLFYNELLTGNIRVVLPDGTLLPEPFAHVDVATSQAGPGRGHEWGLLGLAVDPDFEQNHYVYIYYTKPVRQDVAQPTVMRFTDLNSVGTDPTVLVGDFPETLPDRPGFHVAGNLHFGPDGFLYLTMGEFNFPLFTVNLKTPQGKILRLNKDDGSGIPNNPFAARQSLDTRIYAFGFRNPFDFTFHPESGQLYVSENGPETCDELDIVHPGQYYGWPGSLTPESCKGLPGIAPIYNFSRSGMAPEEPGSPVAPTGLEFVSGDVYPQLGDSLLACESNTGFMRRLVLAGPNLDRVTSDDVIREDCQLSVEASPDGIIYYSNISEIRRLVP